MPFTSSISLYNCQKTYINFLTKPIENDIAPCAVKSRTIKLEDSNLASHFQESDSSLLASNDYDFYLPSRIAATSNHLDLQSCVAIPLAKGFLEIAHVLKATRNGDAIGLRSRNLNLERVAC